VSVTTRSQKMDHLTALAAVLSPALFLAQVLVLQSNQ
jgi:hypothetical protein